MNILSRLYIFGYRITNHWIQILRNNHRHIRHFFLFKFLIVDNLRFYKVIITFTFRLRCFKQLNWGWSRFFKSLSSLRNTCKFNFIYEIIGILPPLLGSIPWSTYSSRVQSFIRIFIKYSFLASFLSLFTRIMRCLYIFSFFSFDRSLDFPLQGL